MCDFGLRRQVKINSNISISININGFRAPSGHESLSLACPRESDSLPAGQ
jgi:hypothetical protein